MNDSDTLSRQITLAAKAYYEGTPLLSDEQFDAAVDRLRALNPSDPVLTAPGWGYRPEGKLTAQHDFTVGSLPKAHDTNNLQTHSVITPKFDGLSIVAYYSNGKLEKVMTRGDGTTGVVVTGRVNVPNTVPDVWVRAVKGEAVLSYPNFKSLNEAREADGEVPYANPRNAVAGIINAHDSKYYAWPSFIAYEIRSSNQTDRGIPMLMDCMSVHGVCEALTRNGFNTSPFLEVADPSEVTLQYLQDWANSHPYPTDGVVHNAVEALKFPTEALAATVVGVNWEQSEKGRLIPVLEIEPTELYGTVVTNPTAYHAKFIESNGLGPGAVVKVTKANEIIPYITEVVSPSPEGPSMPEQYGSSNCSWDGVHLVVKDEAVLREKSLLKFVKTLVTFDGLGDKHLKCIFTSLNVSDIPGMLNILRDCDHFVCQQGSGSYEDLLVNGVTDHQRKLGVQMLSTLLQPVDPEVLLFALNLDAVGQTTSRDLAPFLNQIADPESDPSIWHEKIKQNKDKAITSLESSRDLLKDCLDTLNLQEIQELKPVVLTGTMSRKRKDMVAELKRLGFREEKTVTEETIVVTSDMESSSSKMKKAKKLGVEILLEAEFFEKYGS